MARRFARRRKPRVAWMPTFGGAPIPESSTAPWPGLEVELNLDSGTVEDGVIFDAFPLTFDVSEGAVDAQADPVNKSLRDIVSGNEWRLRRLVGKAFIHAFAGVQGASVVPAIDVSLGFMVCNTDDDGTPQTNFEEVNPLSQESMEDPWFWRRRWILHPYGDNRGPHANVAALNTTNLPEWWGYPQNTAKYGSVADGPHIDSKTARVIHRSERLYGVLACRRFYSGGAVAINDVGIRMLLDYRLLGSLRGASYGNRGHASR